MKQSLQDIRGGETLLADIPAPVIEPGHLLIHSRHSLVSLGTKRMLVSFGRAPLFQKIRSQPDKLRMVLGKMKTTVFYLLSRRFSENWVNRFLLVTAIAAR